MNLKNDAFFKEIESLAWYVRLMQGEDIAQVTEIDREAFPTLWPPTNYRRELESRLSHYIVACKGGKVTDEAEKEDSSKEEFSESASSRKPLLDYNRSFSPILAQEVKQEIIGFAGFWVMAEEAHITSIAVRKIHRRRGIGELLLISLIDLASDLKAHLITLEVRASNIAAQNLYYKYGFAQIGLRCHYYTDNREDALIMTTEHITSSPFQVRFQQLKEAYSRKWGMTLHNISK